MDHSTEQKKKINCSSCTINNFFYKQHAPLPKRDTKDAAALRLVQLHPARDCNAELVIEIVARIDDRKPYEALSWSWGGQTAEKHIRVRHKYMDLCFMITENLDRALRRLRYNSDYRWLWIDYLCINQYDKEEKNLQVPMMSQIYAQAKNACVWLGESDEKSKVAVRFIKEKVLNLRTFDELCKNDAIVGEWEALITLMKRPWFHRRWVVQEIALSDYNKAMIQCGEEVLSWRDFADAVALFNEVETGTHSLSEMMRAAKEFGNIPNFFGHVPELGATKLVEATNDIFRVATGQSDERREPLLSLEHLVSILSIFEASEPRDTIYALLAIAKDTSPATDGPVVENQAIKHKAWQQLLRKWGEKNSMRKSYRVDYGTSLNIVYQDFIIFCAGRADPTRALDILCRPWAPVPRVNTEGYAIEQFPSWVPTLEKAPYKLSEHDRIGKRTIRRNADTLVGVPGRGQYSAAGVKPLTKEFNFVQATDFEAKDTGYHAMHVQGFVLDKLKELEEPSQSGQIPPEWPKMGQWLKRDQPPPEEFWRTLVGDRGPNGRNALPFYPRACMHAFQSCPDDTLDTGSLIDYGSQIVGEFLRRVQAVVWNRRLIRTGEGSLGLAPKGAKKGDLVCILYGCSVPVVLRPKSKEKAVYDKEVEEFTFLNRRTLIGTCLKLLAAVKRSCQIKSRPSAVFDRLTRRLRRAYVEAAKKVERFDATGRYNVDFTAASYADKDMDKIGRKSVCGGRRRYTREPNRRPADGRGGGSIAAGINGNASGHIEGNVNRHCNEASDTRPVKGNGVVDGNTAANKNGIANGAGVASEPGTADENGAANEVATGAANGQATASTQTRPHDPVPEPPTADPNPDDASGPGTANENGAANEVATGAANGQDIASTQVRPQDTVSEQPTGDPDPDDALEANLKGVTPHLDGGVLHANLDKPQQVYYTFIGECYIHGMMNGEAVEARVKWNAEELSRTDGAPREIWVENLFQIR